MHFQHGDIDVGSRGSRADVVRTGSRILRCQLAGVCLAAYFACVAIGIALSYPERDPVHVEPVLGSRHPARENDYVETERERDKDGRHGNVDRERDGREDKPRDRDELERRKRERDGREDKPRDRDELERRKRERDGREDKPRDRDELERRKREKILKDHEMDSDDTQNMRDFKPGIKEWSEHEEAVARMHHFYEDNTWYDVSELASLPYVCEVNVTKNHADGTNGTGTHITATENGTVCPNEYWKGPEDGSCYKVFQRRTSYTEAKKNCANAAKEGHLASIRSESENWMVRKVCGPVQMCWIGLHEKPNSETWSWDDDGTVLSTDNVFWHPGEPNNHDRNDEEAASIGLNWPILRDSFKPDWHVFDGYVELSAICELEIGDRASCPEPWRGPWGGSCYLVLYHLNPLPIAKWECKQNSPRKNAHLVYIHSEDENLKVHELCGGFQPCWIGLGVSNSGWKWFDDSALDYEGWDPESLKKAAVEDLDPHEAALIGVFMGFDYEWWLEYVSYREDRPDVVRPTQPRLDDRGDSWRNWSSMLVVTTLFFTFSNFFIQLILWLILRIAIDKANGDLMVCIACFDIMMALMLLVVLLYTTVAELFGLSTQRLSIPILGSFITFVHALALLINVSALLYVSSHAIALWKRMPVTPIATVLRVVQPARSNVGQGDAQFGMRDTGEGADANGNGWNNNYINGYNAQNGFTNVVGVPLHDAAYGAPVVANSRPVPALPAVSKDYEV